jgi:hypothetical protein
MTSEAKLLMDEALKRVTVKGSFSPADIGARIGLSKPQAEVAARMLSNAGVLVLGFDCSAEFSPAFRKLQLQSAVTAAKPARRKTARRTAVAAK